MDNTKIKRVAEVHTHDEINAYIDAGWVVFEKFVTGEQIGPSHVHQTFHCMMAWVSDGPPVVPVVRSAATEAAGPDDLCSIF